MGSVPIFLQGYVDSYDWTNYDSAIIRGDCAEVIDQGRPMKQ